MGSKRLAMTLRDGEQSVSVSYPERDLGLLGVPLLPEGEKFIVAAGVYANFSVARGQNTEAWSRRSRVDQLLAAIALSRAIEKDLHLLSRDYKYKMPGFTSWRMGGQSGFPVGNLLAQFTRKGLATRT